MISDPPVRLCCMQRHNGPVCPDGKVMCCICFDRVLKDDVYVDQQGDRWDMCQGCGQNEDWQE